MTMLQPDTLNINSPITSESNSLIPFFVQEKIQEAGDETAALFQKTHFDKQLILESITKNLKEIKSQELQTSETDLMYREFFGKLEFEETVRNRFHLIQTPSDVNTLFEPATYAAIAFQPLQEFILGKLNPLGALREEFFGKKISELEVELSAIQKQHTKLWEESKLEVLQVMISKLEDIDNQFHYLVKPEVQWGAMYHIGRRDFTQELLEQRLDEIYALIEQIKNAPCPESLNASLQPFYIRRFDEKLLAAVNDFTIVKNNIGNLIGNFEKDFEKETTIITQAIEAISQEQKNFAASNKVLNSDQEKANTILATIKKTLESKKISSQEKNQKITPLVEDKKLEAYMNDLKTFTTAPLIEQLEKITQIEAIMFADKMRDLGLRATELSEGLNTMKKTGAILEQTFGEHEAFQVQLKSLEIETEALIGKIKHERKYLIMKKFEGDVFKNETVKTFIDQYASVDINTLNLLAIEDAIPSFIKELIKKMNYPFTQEDEIRYGSLLKEQIWRKLSLSLYEVFEQSKTLQKLEVFNQKKQIIKRVIRCYEYMLLWEPVNLSGFSAEEQKRLLLDSDIAQQTRDTIVAYFENENNFTVQQLPAKVEEKKGGFLSKTKKWIKNKINGYEIIEECDNGMKIYQQGKHYGILDKQNNPLLTNSDKKITHLWDSYFQVWSCRWVNKNTPTKYALECAAEKLWIMKVMEEWCIAIFPRELSDTLFQYLGNDLFQHSSEKWILIKWFIFIKHNRESYNNYSASFNEENTLLINDWTKFWFSTLRWNNIWVLIKGNEVIERDIPAEFIFNPQYDAVPKTARSWNKNLNTLSFLEGKEQQFWRFYETYFSYLKEQQLTIDDLRRLFEVYEKYPEWLRNSHKKEENLKSLRELYQFLHII